jgi:hypothetical protein
LTSVCRNPVLERTASVAVSGAAALFALTPGAQVAYEARTTTMADLGFLDGIGRDLSGRGLFGGRFQIRLILQPLLAVVLGVRFGIRDAKHGSRPFFIRMVEAKDDRLKILKQGLRDAVIPLSLALVLDAVLQHMINGRVRPLAAVVVGSLLVWLPFLIVRSLTNRIWKHRNRGHATQSP